MPNRGRRGRARRNGRGTQTAIIEILTEGRATIPAHRTHLAIPQAWRRGRTGKGSALLGRQESRGPQSVPAGRERDLLGTATTVRSQNVVPLEGRQARSLSGRAARGINGRWPSSGQARGCSLCADRRIRKGRRQSPCTLIMLPPRRLLPSAAGRADKRRRVAHAPLPRR